MTKYLANRRLQNGSMISCWHHI